MKESNNIKIGSNKSFGIVFFFIFLIVGFFPLLKNHDIRTWSLVISFIFLTLGIINSKLLSPLNKAWFKFGILLGNFISPIIMGIVFFAVVTPTSLILKFFAKDILKIKKNKKKSYWIKSLSAKSNMKDQF